jgi:hypothetical protein
MTLVEALADVEPRVTIQLLFPAYLANGDQLATVVDEALPVTFRFDEGPVSPTTLFSMPSIGNALASSVSSGRIELAGSP